MFTLAQQAAKAVFNMRPAAAALLLAVSAIIMAGSAVHAQDSGTMAQAYLPDNSLRMPDNFRIEPVRQNQKTYLVNGLGSAVPFIGYGFNHLKKKLGKAEHYSYLTPVEGRVAIQPRVLAQIKRDHAQDRSLLINLVGISYGANIVTALAAQLDKAGIPVNYLAVLDGPMPQRITSNVHGVDNFVCRVPGCMGARLKLASGNSNTIKQEFTYMTTHEGLADDDRVHKRILGQLTSFPLYVVNQRPVDPTVTASISE